MFNFSNEGPGHCGVWRVLLRTVLASLQTPCSAGGADVSCCLKVAYTSRMGENLAFLTETLASH